MPPTHTEDRTQTAVMLEVSKMRRLRTLATLRGTSLAAIVREAVDQYLATQADAAVKNPN